MVGGIPCASRHLKHHWQRVRLDGSLAETVGERDENSLKLLLLILTVIE
jgi:hypothetical protein